jgi:hypothetical protein
MCEIIALIGSSMWAAVADGSDRIQVDHDGVLSSGDFCIERVASGAISMVRPLQLRSVCSASMTPRCLS